MRALRHPWLAQQVVQLATGKGSRSRAAAGQAVQLARESRSAGRLVAAAEGVVGTATRWAVEVGSHAQPAGLAAGTLGVDPAGMAADVEEGTRTVGVGRGSVADTAEAPPWSPRGDTHNRVEP